MNNNISYIIKNITCVTLLCMVMIHFDCLRSSRWLNGLTRTATRTEEDDCNTLLCSDWVTDRCWMSGSSILSMKTTEIPLNCHWTKQRKPCSVINDSTIICFPMWNHSIWGIINKRKVDVSLIERRVFKQTDKLTYSLLTLPYKQTY